METEMFTNFFSNLLWIFGNNSWPLKSCENVICCMFISWQRALVKSSPICAENKENQSRVCLHSIPQPIIYSINVAYLNNQCEFIPLKVDFQSNVWNYDKRRHIPYFGWNKHGKVISKSDWWLDKLICKEYHIYNISYILLRSKQLSLKLHIQLFPSSLCF